MKYSDLSQFHENEALVKSAGSIAGRLVLWVAALLLLCWHDVSPVMMAALSLVMVLPARRRVLLSLAAAGMLTEKILEATGWHWQDQAVQLGLLLVTGIGGLYTFFFLVKHFEQWPAFTRREPILTLHVLIWIALCLSTLPMLGAFAMVPFLTWRLSYMVSLARRGKIEGTKFTDHLFYLVPVYGGFQTPYGKALDFLSRNEAHDPESFARSQLAGIKLLLLAGLWIITVDLIDASIFGNTSKYFAALPESWTLDLPRIAEHIQTGIYPSWYQGWIAIYLELVRVVLRLAITGHVIVGCLRLLGFNVFRNTYKPLLAESIVEFWNRFYFYFKEMLVDFFFYPAYLRMRSLGPRARMFVAVFAAAFLGNMYHHILIRPETVLQLDPVFFWTAWGPRFVYCFLLAAGIWVSMLRQQKLRISGTNPHLLSRIRRIAGVWTFYAIIQIWNRTPEGININDCLGFFMSLFGISFER